MGVVPLRHCSQRDLSNHSEASTHNQLQWLTNQSLFLQYELCGLRMLNNPVLSRTALRCSYLFVKHPPPGIWVNEFHRVRGSSSGGRFLAFFFTRFFHNLLWQLRSWGLLSQPSVPLDYHWRKPEVYRASIRLYSTCWCSTKPSLQGDDFISFDVKCFELIKFLTNFSIYFWRINGHFVTNCWFANDRFTSLKMVTIERNKRELL